MCRNSEYRPKEGSEKHGLYKSISCWWDYLCIGADPNGKNKADAGADHGDAGDQWQYSWIPWNLRTIF